MRLRCGPSSAPSVAWDWVVRGYYGTMAIRIEATVERKDPGLPRFVVVPDDAVAGWSLEGTTMVDVTIDGTAVGRRSLKRWWERGGWFFDLTQDQADRAEVDAGDRIAVELRLASTALPDELRDLLDGDPEARRRWESLTDARRRGLAEHVRSAKRTETRARRASRSLTGDS